MTDGDLRIGTTERDSAREALEEHLGAGRIDIPEYDRRWLTCVEATTQAELMRAFTDLPPPHPDLPGRRLAPADDGLSPLFVLAVFLALVVGMPIAVIISFVYHAWWVLALPVVITVAMFYWEHIRIGRRQSR